MKLILCLAFTLCCNVQLGQSELLSRHKCLAFAFCEDEPSMFEYAQYAKPEVHEENGSYEYHYRLNTDIIGYICSYVLRMSACIQKSNYTSVCEPKVVYIFDAFMRVVSSGCGDYKTDMIEMITCLDDKDIQTNFAPCANNVVRSTMADNCGLAIDDVFEQCTDELRICSPTSVSRIKTFLNDSKKDICFLTNL